jgi:hypothetical protein
MWCPAPLGARVLGQHSVASQDGYAHAVALHRLGVQAVKSALARPAKQGSGAAGTHPLKAHATKLTARERADVNVSKPEEVVGWCNKWGVTPERLRATVAEVGTSALRVAAALGKPN